MLSSLFKLKQNFYSQPLMQQDKLTAAEVHPMVSPKRNRRYIKGIGNAILLLDPAAAQRIGKPAATITQSTSPTGNLIRSVHYQSSSQGPLSAHITMDATAQRILFIHGVEGNQSHPIIVSLLMMAALPVLEHSRQAWANLMHAYQNTPLESTQDLAALSAVRTLSDLMYYEMNRLLQNDGPTYVDPMVPFTPSANTVPVSHIHLGDTTVTMPISQPTKATTSTYDVLQRLQRRGGVAMLVGPTGSLKTETIKRLARDHGLPLISMKGAASVEDRDFIGSIQPDEDSPTGAAWVDGPIARAFRAAQYGPVILQIDEVMRYHSDTIGALVGILDEYSHEEVRLTLKTSLMSELETLSEDQINQRLDDLIGFDETLVKRYYMLTLPTGRVITVPKQHLMWALTTNMGDDFLQAGGGLDAALRSRVSRMIRVTKPDTQTRLDIYTSIANEGQGGLDLAKVALEFELNLDDEFEQGHSLFARPCDLRVGIAFIQEANDCLEDGMSLPDAVQEAATTTLFSFCCIEESDGTLNTGSVARCRELLNTALQFAASLSRQNTQKSA